MQVGPTMGVGATKTADVADQAAAAVAAKGLKQEKQDGADAVRLVESATAPGTGTLVNTYA